jgi:tRNA (cytidine/uridine-2'-O-)-methyltransferase
MHLAIYQPQIPGNTGNIGRLCVGLDVTLHIIGPCAFDFSEKALRRAGLDYWPHLKWSLYDDPGQFLTWLGDRQPWLVSKFGPHSYHQAPFLEDDVIIVGNEVRGLPADWHERWPQRLIAIPILGPIRSFNVGNAAAMVLSQARIQTGHFSRFIQVKRSDASVSHS